jgi:quercetin dioxygenase-like cupin family protein
VIESKKFQLESETSWEDLGNGIKRQLYGYDDKIMMVKVQFEKNAIGAIQSHPHTHVTYLESGAFETTIGIENKILLKGDGFYIPSNVEHGVVCLEPGVLVDVFAPFGNDFLPPAEKID